MKPSKADTKPEIIREICDALLDRQEARAKQIARGSYPFTPIRPQERRISPRSTLHIFLRDAFIDRYSGERLVFPGILRLLSIYLPKEMPFHPNWKMTETHMSYWELLPTIDHVVPIARGGSDADSNRVTTSMMRNAAKANWTMEELGWSLHPAGDLQQWDGLMKQFIALIEMDSAPLAEPYIRKWHDLALETVK